MAAEIQLRLYEELNDALPPDKRKIRFACPLENIDTVKDLLKSINIPEGDVELVLINDTSADFSCSLHDGDFVSIYPVFESWDIRPLIRVRDLPLRQPRFIAGTDLSALAGSLRTLGFDMLDSRYWDFEKLVHVAEEERRIFLTRDPSLSKSPRLSRVYLVRASDPKDQLREVLTRFDLSG
jgi:uncharacterized protein